MEQIISNPEVFIRLTVAMLLGMLLGAERITARKTAGMRTYALVSLGSALFIITSIIISEIYIDRTTFDPLRMASQIVVGIGFLGAGLIIFKGSRLSGLTTAAGLWVSAGIGMAVGYGLYEIAIFTTILTLFVFTALWYLERKVKKMTVGYAKNRTEKPISPQITENPPQ